MMSLATDMGKEPIVSVRDLQVRFQTTDRHATVKAVDGVNFDVRRGETFGIIGESGSGKTTIGRALVFLQKPSAGAILHDGIDPLALPRGEFQSHRRDYQIIFQDPNAALNPRMTILASVLEPLDLARAGNRAERLKQAREALDRVGLPQEVGERYPHQLSGGQKQRVVIARALTLKPKLIVCDEVVAALDMSIRGDVLNLFAELQRDLGLTYVFITHDLAVVSHISERVAVMYLGRFVELGPTEQVSEHPLHPYTQALLSAEPLPLPTNLRAGRRIVLQGEVPSPIDPPSGCRFRTRCPTRKAFAPRRRPTGASSSPITGLPAISPATRIFRRTKDKTRRRRCHDGDHATRGHCADDRCTCRRRFCRPCAGARNAEARRNLAHLGVRQSVEPGSRDRRGGLGSCVPVHDIRHVDRMGF
jgi:oligopeptide/dipeptide ABC transporter ATP-binding protein